MDQHPLANRGPDAANLPLQARLAADGTRFDRAYTVLPICSPARASMLTGLFPHAHGLTENDGRFGGRAGLEPGEWLVSQPFADAGYRTAWFGKWHLDNAQDAGAYGFEGWSLPGYGYPYATEAYRAYLERNGLPDPVARVEISGESGTPVGERIALRERAEWPDYEAGTYLLDGPADVHEAFFVADEAVRWLEGIGDASFFLRVDPWGPHPPYCVAQPFDALFAGADFRSPNCASDIAHRPQHHRDYRDSWLDLRLDGEGWQRMALRSMQQAALVETAMCRVIDALDRLGLADNTIVVACADHGDAVASNGGTANKGGLMVEETVRIPLVLRGPGVGRGRRTDPVTNLDIAPTLLALAGLGIPEATQGCQLLPTPPGRSGVLLQHNGLHVPLAQRAWVEDRWKLVLQEDGFAELYDLSTDPAELSNRAGDPECRAVEERTRAALQDAMASVGDAGFGGKSAN